MRKCYLFPHNNDCKNIKSNIFLPLLFCVCRAYSHIGFSENILKFDEKHIKCSYQYESNVSPTYGPLLESVVIHLNFDLIITMNNVINTHTNNTVQCFWHIIILFSIYPWDTDNSGNNTAPVTVSPSEYILFLLLRRHLFLITSVKYISLHFIFSSFINVKCQVQRITSLCSPKQIRVEGKIPVVNV